MVAEQSHPPENTSFVEEERDRVVYDDTLFAGVLGSLAGDELWQWDPTQARVSAPATFAAAGPMHSPKAGKQAGLSQSGFIAKAALWRDC